MSSESGFVVAVFVLVYIGMALGRVPWFKLDRTGIALLGLIALLGTKSISMADAGRAIDVATLTLLFALMIVSAQFEQAGFYGWVARLIVSYAGRPAALLAVLIAAAGLLSALLTNDVVAFSLTPPLCAAIAALRIDGRPYLIALAAAANAGSAATLIGNPQNILIGQAGEVPFWSYIIVALPPSICALLLCYLAVHWQWQLKPVQPEAVLPAGDIDRFQLAKAVASIMLLGALFLTPLPREISALCVAGLLLVSRRLSSRTMIGAVDWHLLLLFICLFVITAAFEQTGVAKAWLGALAGADLLPDRLAVLTPLTLFASNSIGNVPTVVLLNALLPNLDSGVLSALAMLSTLSGNLLLTGSLCNIIVAEAAAAYGIRLTFSDFARSGIVMTLPALGLTAAWIYLLGLMPL
jgi:Na+/H+ antiporter NhaD/arsenite permease-like protein